MKDETVTSFSYHSKSESIFTTSQNLQFRVWKDDQVQVSWKASAHRTPASSCAFDPSGTLVATGGSDRNVFVWDSRKGHCTHSFKGHTGVVSYVRFHPDARRLLLFTCSDDTTIRVWDLVAHKCVAVLSSHMSVVTSLSFSTDGYTMLSAGRDKIVNVYELRTYGLEKTIPMFESVEAIEVMSDEKQKRLSFVTAGEKGIVRNWTLSRASKAEKYSCKQDSSEETTSSSQKPYIALLRKDNDELVGITNHHIFKFLDSDTLQRKRQFVGYNEEIFDLKYLNQDHVVMATNSENVQIVNCRNYDTSIFEGHEGLVLGVSVSSCGKFVCTVSKDKTCRVWDVISGTCRGVGIGHTDSVGAVCMSRRELSESEAWVVSGSSDKTVKLWDLRPVVKGNNSKRLNALANQMAHAKDINDLAVSPDSRLIASASQDKTIKLWGVNASNKSNILTASKTLKGHKRGVWSVSFSNVDKCLVSGSADRSVRLWAIEQGTCVGVFEGHASSVLRARFVNFGMQLISCDASGLLKLWTIRSSECVNTFEAHEAKIWAMDVSPDGKELVTGSADASLKVFQDCTLELDLKDAEEREKKILQAQELANMVRNGKTREAALLALRLERPHQLRKICTHVLENSSEVDVVDSVVKCLDNEEEIARLVEYLSQWNTSSKNSRVAQHVLQSLLKFVPLDRLKFLAKKQSDSTMADAIISYSERHYRRLNRLLESSYVIEYTLNAMGTLVDGVEEENEEPPTKRLKLSNNN